MIEGYGYANTHTFGTLVELGTVARMAAWRHTHKPIMEIAPAQLKKFITGKGNCKKDLMLKEIYKRWGVDFDDDDCADAYALVEFAMAVLGKSDRSHPKKNMEAVDSWKKSNEQLHISLLNKLNMLS